MITREFSPTNLRIRISPKPASLMAVDSLACLNVWLIPSTVYSLYLSSERWWFVQGMPLDYYCDKRYNTWENTKPVSFYSVGKISFITHFKTSRLVYASEILRIKKDSIFFLLTTGLPKDQFSFILSNPLLQNFSLISKEISHYKL